MSTHFFAARQVAFAFIFFVAGVAFAQAKLDPDAEAAHRHFDLGTEAYDRGDYATALREFERAKLAKPSPALDYNIARCYDRLERYADAIVAYQRFVDGATEDTSDAVARIATLRARVGHSKPAQPAPPRSLSEPARAPESRRLQLVGPSLLGATAVAMAGAGLGLYLSAGSAYDELALNCAPSCDPARWSGLPEREQAGVGLLVAGGALLVGDIVWWVVESRAARRARHARDVGVAAIGSGR